MMVVGREGTNAGGRSFAATEADGDGAVERTRAANEKADVAFRSAVVITSQNVMRRSMISERTAARSCRGRAGESRARAADLISPCPKPPLDDKLWFCRSDRLC